MHQHLSTGNYSVILFFLFILFSGCESEQERKEKLISGEKGENYKVWNAYKVGVNTHSITKPSWCYVFRNGHSFEKMYYNEKGKAYINHDDANVGIVYAYQWRIVDDSLIVTNYNVKEYRESWFIKQLTADTLTFIKENGAEIKLIALKRRHTFEK